MFLSLSNHNTNAGGRELSDATLSNEAMHQRGKASIGHGCVPANMSNGLGWFARFRTQFLPDHYHDPFLSSAIPMVTPTWCHGAN